MKTTITIINSAIVIFVFGCLALSPIARAVVPAPDGGYPGGNTAEGDSALLSLTTGAYNTAVGFASLRALTTGNLNTATGADTLLVNTADGNTATGAAALLSNTTGSQNTANGALALFNNTTASRNTATGFESLFSNTPNGNDNTGDGFSALGSNTTGDDNTAVGASALAFNITGGFNTAVGVSALNQNNPGRNNTAVGVEALFGNLTGANNTAIGYNAGLNQTDGSNNVYIGADIQGVAGESNTCRIKSIFGQTAANGSPVFITSGNKLGTDTSSKRSKEAIRPMDQSSEALYALKPVTFRYKKEIDPEAKSQFGLVAEDVEKVNPDLVVRDKEGKPYTVRYEQVNAMLLNEFLKEHKKVEQQLVRINDAQLQGSKTGRSHCAAAERNGSAKRTAPRAGPADAENERAD